MANKESRKNMQGGRKNTKLGVLGFKMVSPSGLLKFICENPVFKLST